MKRFIVIYTAASGDWLGYNISRVAAETAEEATKVWEADRRAHPMRMRYHFTIAEEGKWGELDTRKPA